MAKSSKPGMKIWNSPRKEQPVAKRKPAIARDRVSVPEDTFNDAMRLLRLYSFGSTVREMEQHAELCCCHENAAPAKRLAAKPKRKAVKRG